MPDKSYRYLKVHVEHGILVMAITERELHDTNFDVIDTLRTEMLDAAAQAPMGKVVIDLSAVEMLGSGSFRPLFSLRRQLHNMYGELMLCGMQPMVREVFLVTCLIDKDGSSNAPFPAAADVRTALARLGA